MDSVTFSGYQPTEPEDLSVIDVTLGVFFDGTLNNKNNSEEKKNNTEAFQKYGQAKKEDTSYYNDWSNVARLWEGYDPATRIYIEGIGTNDREKDRTLGFAFGTAETGIRAKVRKGCEEIVNKIPKGKKVSFLTLDVYGFSRGAAAARNFVYEIGKNAYKATTESVSAQGTTISANYDSDGMPTSETELPANGHLGLVLKRQGVEVMNIRVRFLGIFDTVSSYSKYFSIRPNFDDVEELSLNKLSKARNVVHFVAENEHRENFSLTHTRTGQECSFPGVHSDIGGSYNDGEEVIKEIETSWTSKFNLNPTIKWLTDEGWYHDEQLEITGGNLYWALQGTRNLSKKYSYIPLHFMAEKAIEKESPFNLNFFENQKYKITDDAFLGRIKTRLRKYVFENGSPYVYKKSPPAEEIEEQNDLKKLRNEFLHWSARREGIGMDPNSNRERVTY